METSVSFFWSWYFNYIIQTILDKCTSANVYKLCLLVGLLNNTLTVYNAGHKIRYYGMVMSVKFVAV